jgi:UDP-N-acetylglucosamine 2-epimerase (hydrolysing)
MTKKVLFLTGTRADYGKLKPLIGALRDTEGFLPQIFVTGMHMLERFGSTWEEVVESGLASVYPFVNQAPGDSMDVVLAKTVTGLSDFVKESAPDLIVVHGDRVEALAGSIVGTLNNIRVAHIEGGELSGTVDEVLRHAVSKLSHWHFVSNDESRNRLLQLGEADNSVFVIGSPDIDVMDSPNLPDVREAMDHYDLDLVDYGILIYHPVTTELDSIEANTHVIMEALAAHPRDIIVIESNNDWGSQKIRQAYASHQSNPKFHFFPSMRFEYFLAILRNAKFMIGNSSAGIREAPHYGVPTINLGTRQHNRVRSSLVLNTEISREAISESLQEAGGLERVPEKNFGDGRSVERFMEIVQSAERWSSPIQKQFVDRPSQDGKEKK